MAYNLFCTVCEWYMKWCGFFRLFFLFLFLRWTYWIGQWRKDRKQMGEVKRDLNSGYPRFNCTICQSAAHEAMAITFHSWNFYLVDDKSGGKNTIHWKKLSHIETWIRYRLGGPFLLDPVLKWQKAPRNPLATTQNTPETT